jgi:UDP-2,3-diacylglucosamine pyrophosphatase LpxH
MAKTKRLFISDIHLSAKALYDDPDTPTWYDPKEHGHRLLSFLEAGVLAQKDRIKDVILLGDIFNAWVCPAQKPPPKFTQIFFANKPVINRLKKIAASGINLFFVPGNHDFELDRETLEKAIPKIKVINCYRSGRIYAEHGHRYDIYNKPDFVTDPAFGRPIGYFISRLAASMATGGYGIIDLVSYIDDILEAALSPQNIFSAIIEGLAERANMKETDEIIMPDQKRVSVAELKIRFERLSGVYTLNELINDLYQRRYLNAPADRLCKRHDLNVVIFGHTHNAMLDKDWFSTEDRIYANTGSWCKKNAYCVEVDKSRDVKAPVFVRLHKIGDNGQTSETREEAIG